MSESDHDEYTHSGHNDEFSGVDVDRVNDDESSEVDDDRVDDDESSEEIDVDDDVVIVSMDMPFGTSAFPMPISIKSEDVLSGSEKFTSNVRINIRQCKYFCGCIYNKINFQFAGESRS